MEINDPIKVVTPTEFSQKIVNGITVAMKTLEGVIFPIGALGLVSSILVLIIGSAFHSKTLRMIGTVGLASVSGGLLLYLGYPLILGLLKGIGQALR